MSRSPYAPEGRNISPDNSPKATVSQLQEILWPELWKQRLPDSDGAASPARQAVIMRLPEWRPPKVNHPAPGRSFAS